MSKLGGNLNIRQVIARSIAPFERRIEVLEREYLLG